MKNVVLLAGAAAAIATGTVHAAPPPAPVDHYPIHADGGLVYDPMRREAERTGRLTVYDNAPVTSGELALGKWNLRFGVPRQCEAYDAVPIPYELRWTGTNNAPTTASFPVAVEAVAFEESERRTGRDLFDLALPGKIDLKVEYLGSVTAHLTPEVRHNMEPDCSDTPGAYPAFIRRPFVRSGVVESGDLVWFKFRYTNTGNTILDPDGFGGCQLFPELHRKSAEGKYEFLAHINNLYVRNLGYLYPGESAETWFLFAIPAKHQPAEHYKLDPGDYRIRFRLTARVYRESDPVPNYWDGPVVYAWDQLIKVRDAAQQAPVLAGSIPQPEKEETTTTAKRAEDERTDLVTRFIHTFEEFMTAFDCYQAPPALDKGGKSGVIRGTLHLQVAPWTKHVVVKLVDTNPLAVKSSAVPVDVTTESLRIAFNPNSPIWVTRNGVAEPALVSQSMADMRVNVQLGPYPEIHIRERLREMMDDGINIVSMTAMPWLYADMTKPDHNYPGDAWKYFLDLARQEGMAVEGWGAYPYDRGSIKDIASWITGRKVDIANCGPDFPAGLSLADPALPGANAQAWLYQFRRWGDLYYQTRKGEVPISIEDTRGWLRDDINIRYPMGELTMNAFRDWVRRKYGTIAAVNAAWKTTYRDFADIQPEHGQVVNRWGHKWEYTDASNPLHDWNDAMADLDAFRTELRVRNFRETLDVVRRTIPTATLCLRTEGGNVLVSGIDPTDPNAHLRHIYFSQRRCAMIAEILQKSGIPAIHADYTTIPYTPSELRRLIPECVKQGVVPAWMPYFNDMRDVAINDRYGMDYQTHYNLPSPAKGYMIHVLTAAYPWFKIMHEEGGVPGILWEDYQCAGFATETQKKEVRLFSENLKKAMTSPEAMKLRQTLATTTTQEWRKASQSKCSYNIGKE